MPFPNWLAGMRITADRLEDRNIHVVEQAADQIVTNSTTLIDTNLLIPGEVGAVYQYQAHISFSATATPDFRWAWVAPSGTDIRRYTMARIAAAATGLNTGSDVIMRTPALGTEMVAGGGDADGGAPVNFFYTYEQGLVYMGGTAGSCVIRFAQFTSNANQTIFRNLSRLIYSRIR